jgi:hypothetical protein
MIPYAVLFFVIYNVVLFKIIKRFVLKSRLERHKDEINDALIETLKSFYEFDYKGAYEYLEEALKKYPDSFELNNIKILFDKKMKEVNTKSKELQMK